MNKKIILVFIIVIAVAGLIFLVVERRRESPEPALEVSEIPLKESISLMREEIRVINEEAWLGKITQEEATEKLIALEDKVAELIAQHGFQAEVDEYVAQRKTDEERWEGTEERLMTIVFWWRGIAEIDVGLAEPLREEGFALFEEIKAGLISQVEADEKLTAFEDKIAELIDQHGIQAEVDEYVAREEARQKAVEELRQWAEPRIRVIDLHLGGMAEYFSQKYGIDTGTEVQQSRTLQDELREFSVELREVKISQEEAEKRLSELENQVAGMIAEYDLIAEVDEYVAEIEAGLEHVGAIGLRIEEIQQKLTAIEVISDI